MAAKNSITLEEEFYRLLDSMFELAAMNMAALSLSQDKEQKGYENGTLEMLRIITTKSKQLSIDLSEAVSQLEGMPSVMHSKLLTDTHALEKQH